MKLKLRPQVEVTDPERKYGRWDSMNNRYLTPKQDFQKMCDKVSLPYNELYWRYKANAERDQPGFDQFCKSIIQGLDACYDAPPRL